jgi:general secretion pathway protein G
MKGPAVSHCLLRPCHRDDDASSGFTLIEILVVVVILGILAAVIVPQITTASEQSEDHALKTTLNRVRQQLQVYRQHHRGDWPQDFVRQMTRRTNHAGETPAGDAQGSPAQYPFGPYLRHAPVNPATGGNSITTSDDVGAADWYYNPQTGTFKANGEQAHREY